MKPGDIQWGANFVKIGPIIIQWGNVVAASTGTPVVFPIPYAATPTMEVTTEDTNSQQAWQESVTKLGFTAHQEYTGASLNVHWVAFGHI